MNANERKCLGPQMNADERGLLMLENDGGLGSSDLSIVFEPVV
jgi:hypothetical protein